MGKHHDLIIEKAKGLQLALEDYYDVSDSDLEPIVTGHPIHRAFENCQHTLPNRHLPTEFKNLQELLWNYSNVDRSKAKSIAADLAKLLIEIYYVLRTEVPGRYTVRTISDWHRALKHKAEELSIPINQGDSLAKRLSDKNKDKNNSDTSASSKEQLTDQKYDERIKANPFKLPPEYIAYARLNRQIALYYGIKHPLDAEVLRQAVRAVANHTNFISTVIWKMVFEQFFSAFSYVVLLEKMGSPPTPMQQYIWNALYDRSMKTQELANKVSNGDRSRLYYTDRKTKTGGLKEMEKVGCVAHKHTVGYYRLDAPSAKISLPHHDRLYDLLNKSLACDYSVSSAYE